VRISAVSGLMVATLLVGQVTARAETRVALVIGNSAYQNAPRLPNPSNDAADVAATLKRSGFETILATDLDKTAMDAATIRFARVARNADVAMFYYSGHAMQFGGVNYLMPVDAKLTDEADLRRMVRLDEIVSDLQQAKNLRVLVLDSCRDNPLSDELKRSIGTTRAIPLNRGLARIDSPQQGMIVAYATQAGRTATDGTGRNSPYTAAFVKNIESQEEIGTIFRRISADVYETTKHNQLPELSLSLIGEFYLNGKFTAAPAKTSAPSDPCAVAESHWRSAEAINTRVVFEDHLSRYPNCAFAELARARIEALSKVASVPPKASESVSPTPTETERPGFLGRLFGNPAEKSTPPAPTPAPLAKHALLVPIVPPISPAPCDGDKMTVSLSSRSACPLSIAVERALKPKDTFKECDKCPEMVVVPSGSFTMGSPSRELRGDPLAKYGYEGPQHRVTIGKAFAVGRFSVTFDEWDACVAAGGCGGYKPADEDWGRGRRPVINVSWDDAKAYVAWLSQMTGKPYRLLSEAEREYVTRAGTNTPFWWGSSITTKQANYDATDGSQKNDPQHRYLKEGAKSDRTVPVDSFDPNPWGLYQVHGNVDEYVEDCWHESYARAPTDGSAWTTGCGGSGTAVIRGGGFEMPKESLRSGARLHTASNDDRGTSESFRIARMLSP
jgi:formylglycine-generating enzyme required for sulfatase activity